MLPPLAMEVLAEAKKFGDGDGYVFPGVNGSFFNNMSGGKQLLDKMMDGEMLDILPWVLHDLRRTARTLLERAGIELYICERILGHTLQGPHVIRIAIGFGAFDQLEFDLRTLVSAQLRQPPRTTCAKQSISPRPTPRGTPVGDDLMRHTNLACDLGRNDALLEQIGGAHAPLLHRGKIAPRPYTPLRCPARVLLYRNTGGLLLARSGADAGAQGVCTGGTDLSARVGRRRGGQVRLGPGRDLEQCLRH